jgi:hypothetical protein
MKELAMLDAQGASLALALLTTSSGLAQEKALTPEGQRFLTRGLEQL